MSQRLLTVISCLTLTARLFAFQSSSPATSPAATAPSPAPTTRPAPDGTITITDFLVLPPVGVGGRSLVHTDAIEAIIVAGGKLEPKTGDTVKKPDGETRAWETAKCEPDGTLRHDALKGGYAYARIELPATATYILHALGHNMVYVNGVPRTGDPYSYGFVQLPVRLDAGVNHLLFSVGRGSLRAQLKPGDIRKPWIEADSTAPTFPRIFGAEIQVSGELAVPVMNIDSQWREITQSLGPAYVPTTLNIAPHSVVKAPLGFSWRGSGQTTDVTLKVQCEAADRVESISLNIPLSSAEHGKRTFRSRIDGSVQYYGYRNARSGAIPIDMRVSQPTVPPHPVILSLHGASVEATNQIASYAAGWADIIAPTNRRPFGFDWEDWGRSDALESLQDYLERGNIDRSRIYLTGHSMGGHGTWNVGVLYPDLFAAIGPSAGWTSFWSYGNMKRWDAATPLSRVLQQAHNPSDTLAMLTNLKPRGVYILHGDADETVPVAQAREMREKLAPFHRDFDWHEQPAAGHWWDNSDEPGAACVDWPPMMDYFAHHRRPSDGEVRDIDFVTPNPAISARLHWAIIEQQQKSLALSRVKLHAAPHTRRIEGSTENVRRLTLEIPWVQNSIVPDAKPFAQIKLDGEELVVGMESLTHPKFLEDPFEGPDRFVYARVHLLREKDKWSLADPPPPTEKHRRRAGPFKHAFDNRFLLVVGTTGTCAEYQALLAKARLDSETWWVRGNGNAELMTDRDYLAATRSSEPTTQVVGLRGQPVPAPPQPTNPDNRGILNRNIILYGNADTNAAWSKLLADSPVQVRRGAIRIGERELTGDNLACLFIRPIPDSTTASVGVIASSGAPGQRLTERLPIFVSGVAFPDVLVYSTDMLTKADAGIRAAGFFGPDWKVETGDFGFAD